MKGNITLFIIICTFVTIGYANATESPYIEIEIKEVFSKLIVCDIGDRVYSGQIKSQTGLEEFSRQYSLDLGIDNVDFKQKMLIFGITDDISTRAFRFLKHKNLNSFYLDYYDTGIQYKLLPLPEGKRYSYLQVFLIDKIDGIPHIWVKNLVRDKLSKVYE